MKEKLEFTPLKKELPADVREMHEKSVESAERTIDIWMDGDPNAVAVVAEEVHEMVHDINVPREVVPRIYKYAYDQIGPSTSLESGEEAVRTFIETIRELDDPELRVNLTAILAYDMYRASELADAYLDSISSVESTKSQEAEELLRDRLMFRREAIFSRLAESEDEDPRIRAWAKSILNPSEKARAFLAKFSPDDLLQPATILQERELIKEGTGDSGRSAGEMVFTGRRVRLPAGWMPSVEKIKEYYQRTERLLLPSLAYEKDGVRIYTDLTESFARRAFTIGYRKKRGTITALERQVEMESLMVEFMETLDEAMQAEMAEAIGLGLELRFTTERSASQANENLEALAQAEQAATLEYQQTKKALADLEAKLRGYRGEEREVA